MTVNNFICDSTESWKQTLRNWQTFRRDFPGHYDVWQLCEHFSFSIMSLGVRLAIALRRALHRDLSAVILWIPPVAPGIQSALRSPELHGRRTVPITMIPKITSSTPNLICRTGLIGLVCSLGFFVAHVPTARAADSTAPSRLEDKAPSLPLTYTFEKMTEGESGPYVLHLKNISSDAITVDVHVISSVAFHANSRVRNLPGHAIAAGEVWTITELAAADKVTISAKGFATLELTVP